jgi:hypothetical protein
VGTIDLIFKTFLHAKGLKSHKIHQLKHTCNVHTWWGLTTHSSKTTINIHQSKAICFLPCPHAAWHNYFNEKYVLCIVVRLVSDWEAETRQRQYFYIDRYNMIKIAFQRPYVILLFPPSLIINSYRLRIQDC